MKRLLSYLTIIVIVLIPFTFYSCGTMYGAKGTEDARNFERIGEFPNVSKSDLYIRANSWFVATFVSAESVIEFNDKESGKIMGKFTYEYDEGVYTYRVRQVISVDIKDGKIRFIVNDPYYRVTSGAGKYYSNTPYNMPISAIPAHSFR